MVTTLCLVRHGETEGSEIPRYKGSIDVPLSLRGEEQVRQTSLRLAEYLSRLLGARQKSYLRDIHENKKEGGRGSEGTEKGERVRLDAIYCSPLCRATKSAKLIAAPHGLEPVAIPDLRERHFGVWEGLTFSEIKEGWPQAFSDWAADPVNFAPPEGESTLEVARRGERVLAELLPRHRGQSLALVAHGGINRVLLCQLLGLPLANLFRLEQDLACFNIIEMWNDLPVLKLLNAAP